MSTAIDPIFAARAGMIPCHPRPPCITPGTSCSLRGSTEESSRRPGKVTPWKRTGLKSITSPVQLMSQPTTAVKTGIDQNTSQSTSASHSRDVLTPSAGPGGLRATRG